MHKHIKLNTVKMFVVIYYNITACLTWVCCCITYSEHCNSKVIQTAFKGSGVISETFYK